MNANKVPYIIRPPADCTRTEEGRDTSNCGPQHACKHPGSGIGQRPAHDERRGSSRRNSA